MHAQPILYLFRPFLTLVAICTTTFAWAASPLDGALKVSNARMDAVHVYIDGKPVGIVQANANRTFRSVPNGVRLIKITPQTTGIAQRRVSIPVKGTGHVQVPALLGRARIYNGAGIRMRVAVDGRYAGTVAAGKELVLRPLAEGKHRVVAYPSAPDLADLGQLDKSVFIRAGQDHRIEFGSFFGHLTVQNPFSHRVALRINGKRVTRLMARDSVRLPDLRAGTYTVELRRRGRTMAATTVEVRRGASVSWQPTYDDVGTLKIANRRRGPITIASASFGRRTLDAGETLRLQLATGEHQIRVFGRRRTGVHTVAVDSTSTTKLILRRGGRRHASKYPVDRLYAHR
ncbi:MAG: hypothetical protein VX589_06705 [Myxococcota bacterium]|nr:hypothetical protein [Myxococcota bacterium]